MQSRVNSSLCFSEIRRFVCTCCALCVTSRAQRCIHYVCRVRDARYPRVRFRIIAEGIPRGSGFYRRIGRGSRANDFAAEAPRAALRTRRISSRVDKLPFNRRKKHHVPQETGKQSREKSRRAGRGAEWPTRLVQMAIRSHQTVKRRAHLRERTSRARVRTYVDPRFASLSRTNDDFIH